MSIGCLADGVSEDPLTHDVEIMGVRGEIYSLDITWGSHKFDYKLTNWDPQTHKYKTKDFLPADDDGDIIKVVNHSNAPVNLLISCNGSDEISVFYLLNDYNKQYQRFDYKEEDCYKSDGYTIDAGEVDDYENAPYIKFKTYVSFKSYPKQTDEEVAALPSEYTTIGYVKLSLLPCDE